MTDGESEGGCWSTGRERQSTVNSRCVRGRVRLLPLLSHLKQAEAGS